MSTKINIPKNTLRDLYLNKDMTTRQIASIYKCNRSVISRRLKENKINIRRHKRKYSNFYKQKLTREQKEILYGSLLGDGCIAFHHKGENCCRYIETHSAKQLEYLKWKMKKLDNFISIKEPYKVDNSKNNSFGSGFSYRFNTILHSEFSKIREKFYNSNGKKVIPIFKLTPLSFAMWYYDDGSINDSGNRISISSLDFDDNSINNLLKMLKDDLKLQAKTHERKWKNNGVVKSGKMISFNKANVELILDILKPYKIKSVEYKLR